MRYCIMVYYRYGTAKKLQLSFLTTCIISGCPAMCIYVAQLQVVCWPKSSFYLVARHSCCPLVVVSSLCLSSKARGTTAPINYEHSTPRLSQLSSRANAMPKLLVPIDDTAWTFLGLRVYRMISAHIFFSVFLL